MGGSIFKVFLLFFLHQLVTSQVCNETTSVYREVPETYRYTYIETYEEPCLIFCSTKTRQAVDVATRFVQRYENVTANVCCEGYGEDDSHEGNGLYCKPLCNPPCQNGYCRRPNQCACEVGYALDPLNPNACKPLCLEGCDIPNCIATKTLQCFSNNTELSSPICTEPCVNATCIAGDVCQCFPGYQQISRTACEPQHSCQHEALNLDSCESDEGWQWQSGSCQPICFECEHGTCVTPGECECVNGYVKADRGKCEPYCLTGCANGKCVAPDICSCNPGWYMVTDNGECIAHCDFNCEHGDCIGPNICECHPGYQLDTGTDPAICVPNQKDCEDSNSEIEDCKCEPPYEATYFTDEGRSKSTCLFMDIAFDTNTAFITEGTPVTDPKTTKQVADDSTSTFPTIDRNDEEDINVVKTISNSYNPYKNSQALGLPVNWMYVIAAVGVLIVILVLGFIIKRKCSKPQIINLPNKNDDIIVHYVKNIS